MNMDEELELLKMVVRRLEEADFHPRDVKNILNNTKVDKDYLEKWVYKLDLQNVYDKENFEN